MKDFRKLQVWEKRHHLVLSIYERTKSFPKDERYGLIAQMRRSSASIPANIAEGCGRNSQKESGNHLIIASGSASELEYQGLRAHDLGYINGYEQNVASKRIVEVKKMLSSLTTRIKADS